ncbi:MAG: hypothetical protein HQK98_08645 [Nitrospirae bacterium]|nr:hypothetical protein [Nitrospirota bacterium]
MVKKSLIGFLVFVIILLMCAGFIGAVFYPYQSDNNSVIGRNVLPKTDNTTAAAKTEQKAKDISPSPTPKTKAAEEKTSSEHGKKRQSNEEGMNPTLVVWFFIILGVIVVVIVYLVYRRIVPRKNNTNTSDSTPPPRIYSRSDSDQGMPDSNIKANIMGIFARITTIESTIRKINEKQDKILTEFNELREIAKLEKFEKGKKQQGDPIIPPQSLEDVPTRKIVRPSQNQPDLDEDGKLLPESLTAQRKYSTSYDKPPAGYAVKEMFLKYDPTGNYVVVPDGIGNTAKCYPIDMEIIDPNDTYVYKIERKRDEQWRIVKPATCVRDKDKFTSIGRGHIVGPTKK